MFFPDSGPKLSQEEIQAAYNIFREDGLTFYDKRQFLIPEISDQRLRLLVDGDRSEFVKARSRVDFLQSYLGMVRITSEDLLDELKREEYLRGLRKRGQHISEVWDNKNQFRGNRNTSAIIYMQSLGFSADKNDYQEIGQALKDQSRLALLAMRGALPELGLPNLVYRFIPDINSRIKVLDYIEDRVFDSLTILACAEPK